MIGLWILGTALAELLNLIVMRLVPPHRSREAVGVIGAVAGIVIALFFQILIDNASRMSIDLPALLAGQEGMLKSLPISSGFLGIGCCTEKFLLP